MSGKARVSKGGSKRTSTEAPDSNISWRDLRDKKTSDTPRQVALRCSDEEYAQILRNAQRANCKSIADYMRLSMLIRPPIDERGSDAPA